MGRAIDIDKLCTDLMERWGIADKQKEELVRQVMADIVVPIVVSQPTVEPERKKGKWVPAKDGYEDHVECTGCFKTYDWISQAQYYDFCPSCGADMRELENKPRP
jgi:endogenous inhibitor of DNA gyrase (YacG/DUF329 family)